MAALCHFYRMTPSEFWRLERDELDALVRYREQWIEANKQSRR